ncbi:reverse transcriptase domain-containing protein, partial [Tanacetum coccineum]
MGGFCLIGKMIRLFKVKEKQREIAENSNGMPPTKKQSPGELRLNKDISELNLPKTCSIKFPNGKDDLMNFQVTVKPDEGYYLHLDAVFCATIEPKVANLRSRSRLLLSILMRHQRSNAKKGYTYFQPSSALILTVYHPNIDLDGNVCLNILREDWKPVLNINTVIYGLYHLFTEPNHEDPLNSDAAAVLRDNPTQFGSNVRKAMAASLYPPEIKPPGLLNSPSLQFAKSDLRSPLCPLEPLPPFQLLRSSCTVLFVSAEAQRDRPTFKLLSNQTSSYYTYDNNTETLNKVELFKILGTFGDDGDTPPMVPEVIYEPAQDEAAGSMYETLGDLVKRFHDHTEAIPVHRILVIERVRTLGLTCNWICIMVPDEEDRVERFIGGLPNNIQGNVIAANPARLQDAIRIANQLMDKKLQGYAARSAENKKRMESNPRDNCGQQPPFKRQNVSGQNVARAYAAGNNEKRGYAGPHPLCNKCRYHHVGLCTVKCNNCNRVGHQMRDCRSAAAIPNTQRAPLGNQQGVICYECGRPGHTGGNKATTTAYAIGGGRTNPDSNVVTGMFLLNNYYASMLFDSGADRSFMSSTFSALLDVAPSTLDTSYA